MEDFQFSHDLFPNGRFHVHHDHFSGHFDLSALMPDSVNHSTIAWTKFGNFLVLQEKIIKA